MATIKRIKTTDLQKITDAAVKAVLGKGIPKRPGSLAGFWLAEGELEALGRPALALAKETASKASLDLGIKLKPVVVKTPGGVLVGYRQPQLRLPPR